MAEVDETQHTAANVRSSVRMCYLVGDANADALVDISDYVVTANYILGRNTDNLFFSDAANAAYSDNTINVTDLVAITNIALELRDKEYKPSIDGYQLAPAVVIHGNDYPLTAKVTKMNSNETVVAIAVDNDMPLAAMQFDIDLPAGTTLKAVEINERSKSLNASFGTSPEGKTRVILSAFGTKEIESGSGDILTLVFNGTPRNGGLTHLTDVVMTERNLTEHGAIGDLIFDLNQISDVTSVCYDHVNIYGRDGAVVIESPIEGRAQIVRINGINQTVTVQPGRNVYPLSVSRGDIIIATFNDITKKIQF